MKIRVNQKQLSECVNIVQKGISGRTTMQILDGILIEAADNRLKLTATDLEIRIESYLDCDITGKGRVVVNSRIFGDIVKKLPNSTINIDVTDNNIHIVCENSETNILGSLAADYPELPSIISQSSFKIPKQLFKSAVRQTIFATAQDETRPVLTGILLEISNGQGSFVALDGYRLAIRSFKLDYKDDKKIIIPSRALGELNKILDDDGDFTITTGPGHVVFNIGDNIVSSRLLEGQFLNYKDIIRDEHKTSVIVGREELLNSLERASLLAKEDKANLVRLNIANNQIIIKSNSEIGSVNEEVMSELDGEDIDIAFNSRYIIDGIKAMTSEKIKLMFMGGLNPCIMNPIGDESYTYLVLPVRLAQDDY